MALLNNSRRAIFFSTRLFSRFLPRQYRRLNDGWGMAPYGFRDDFSGVPEGTLLEVGVSPLRDCHG